MLEFRWHGRAGQGIITAIRLLASSAILEGKYVQAFPQFGPERIGAPIVGYCRISETPITLHGPIESPDVVAVLDPTIIGLVDVVEGLKRDGIMVVNSKDDPRKLAAKLGVARTYTIDATGISLDIMGSGRAVNIAVMGAVTGVTGIVSRESLVKVLSERFTGRILDMNLKVLDRSLKEVKGVEG
jgi:2-oxoacid:acceptor oxidoreductase gamma subunit (pyruvate/2-ketoisovalerate family)